MQAPNSLAHPGVKQRKGWPRDGKEGNCKGLQTAGYIAVEARGPVKHPVHAVHGARIPFSSAGSTVPQAGAHTLVVRSVKQQSKQRDEQSLTCLLWPAPKS